MSTNTEKRDLAEKSAFRRAQDDALRARVIAWAEQNPDVTQNGLARLFRVSATKIHHMLKQHRSQP